MRRWQIPDRLRSRDGNVAIIFAMSIVPAIFAAGMGLDYGRALLARSEMQAALDGAVVGALTQPSNQQLTQGLALFNANFHRKNVTDLKITITPFENGSLQGAASASVKATVTRILNKQSFAIAANATAGGDASPSTSAGVVAYPCIHILDQSAMDALYMDSTSSLDARACEVHIRSNRSRAMKSVSSSNVTFKKILVKGGAEIGGGSITVVDSPFKVMTDSAITEDPFSGSIHLIAKLMTVDTCRAANTGKSFTAGSVTP